MWSNYSYTFDTPEPSPRDLLDVAERLTKLINDNVMSTEIREDLELALAGVAADLADEYGAIEEEEKGTDMPPFGLPPRYGTFCCSGGPC